MHASASYSLSVFHARCYSHTCSLNVTGRLNSNIRYCSYWRAQTRLNKTLFSQLFLLHFLILLTP